MLAIRNTRISDAPAVTQCIAAVASERCYLLSTKGFSLERTQEFIQFVRNTGGVHLVILDGVDIVGWCDVAPGTFEGMTHAGQLGMGFLPQYRGQGWGRKLLTHALEAAFRQNFERVELTVFASNTVAAKLYRSLGFQEEGRKRKARKLDGKYDDILVYALLREEWGAC